MSTNQLFHTPGGQKPSEEYTMADLRAMKPIGTPLPRCPQSTLDQFVFTCEVLEQTADQLRAALAEAEERKRQKETVPSFFGSLRQRLHALSRAATAYDRASVQQVEGRYYCVGPRGEVLEAVICRRGKISKTELLVGGVVPLPHLVPRGGLR